MRLTKIFHSQSGRSLVEVLAVLAIIGILSLAGILGVQYAMEANRENETLNRFSKVVAGARTSRILENLGEKTKFNQNTGEERKDGYVRMPVDMHDVISNIGDDIYASSATDVDGQPSVNSYILAPLKGPFKDGTEEKVEIRVYVETPDAFTVHAKNLTFNACMKVVQADLGYSFTYDEGSEDWRQPSQVQTTEGAKVLCEKIAPQNKTGGDTAMVYSPFVRRAVAASPSNEPGTLVMWFGPYACMGDGCAAGKCGGAECCCTFEDGGRVVSLTDPAPVGCAAVDGKCVGCAEPDSKGICSPKSGISNCEPKCTLDICQNAKNPYYCGDGLCCPSAATCGDGRCIAIPSCTEPGRPNPCGEQCCSADEKCNTEKGICEPFGICTGAQQTCTKQTDGTFSHCCGPIETCCGTICCSASQQCGDFDKCESIKCNEGSPTYCAPNLCCNPENSKCDKEKGECVPACPAGETQYCAEEGPITILAIETDNNVGQCKIKTSDCIKYACTKETLILKDPNGPKKRSIEVPMKGIKGYSYCADEVAGKCALVTYCNTKPLEIFGHMLQQCNACTPGSTSVPGNFWNPRTQVCKGNKIVDISSLVDKRDALFLAECNGDCSPCSAGFLPMADGTCCELAKSTAWIECDHCSPPPTFTDKCGRTQPTMDICCAKSDTEDEGCTSPSKKNSCITNFPVDGKCCKNACLSEKKITSGGSEDAGSSTGGDNNKPDECCAEGDIAQNRVCCSSDEPGTPECCALKGREWSEKRKECCPVGSKLVPLQP